MTKVLVCGGRDYDDKKRLYKVLDSFHKETPIDLLIQGGAKGADKLAYLWAITHKIETHTFMANWKKYGLRAGFIRNQEMLTEGKPDQIIAFPGGRGTDNMIDLAIKYFIPLNIIVD